MRLGSCPEVSPRWKNEFMFLSFWKVRSTAFQPCLTLGWVHMNMNFIKSKWFKLMISQMGHGQIFWRQYCPIGRQLKKFSVRTRKMAKNGVFLLLNSLLLDIFCEGKFFWGRTMWKFTSWSFRKCGSFGAWEFFNRSYCCWNSKDLPWLQICISSKFGHQMAPLALVRLGKIEVRVT